MSKRKIPASALCHALQEMLAENNPLSEDILITDDSDQLVAAIIKPDAYRAFMQLIEEAEDERDDDIIANAKPYDPNTAIPLDDL